MANLLPSVFDQEPVNDTKGYGLLFNSGSGNYVLTIGSSSILALGATTPFTVEFYVTVFSNSQPWSIFYNAFNFTNNQGSVFQIGSGNNPIFFHGNTSYTSGTAITSGVPTYLSYTYDGSAHLYIHQNGTLTDTVSFTGLAGVAANGNYIGSETVGNATRVGNGVVSEFRFSNTARYTSSNYTPPKTQFAADTSTLLLYHFNEGQNSTNVVDSSGNNLAATFNGTYPIYVPTNFPSSSATPNALQINVFDVGTPYDFRQNLVTNPSFETTSQGTVFWSFGSAGSTGGLTNNLHDTSQSLFGSASASFQQSFTGGTSSVAQYYLNSSSSSGGYFVPTNGVTYIFSAYIFVPSGSPLVQIGLGIRDFSTFSYISNNGSETFFTITANQWTRVWATATATPAHQEWRFTIGDPATATGFSGTTTWYVDGTQLEVLPPDGLPSPYLDGSIQNYQWDGSANNAISETSRDLIFLQQAPIQVFDAETVTENVNIEIVDRVSVGDSASSLVQSSTVVVATGTSTVTVPFPFNVTPGNMLVFLIGYGGTSAGDLGISTTQSDSILTAISKSATNLAEMLYVKSAVGGATTLTITRSASHSINVGIYEYQGFTSSPLDTTNSNSGTSATPSPGSITPSQVGELVISFAYGANTMSPISGWNPRSGSGNTSFGGGSGASAEDYAVPSTAAVTGTFTMTSGTWQAVTASFLRSGNSLPLSETQSIVLVDIVNVSDTETETDVLTNIEIINQGVNVFDAETVTENVNIQLVDTINVSDTETETDVVTRIQVNVTINVSDTETETDVPTVTVPLLGPINVFDTETETESVTIAQALTINVFDTETETEFVDVIRGGARTINVFETETESDVPFINTFQINVFDLGTPYDFRQNLVTNPSFETTVQGSVFWGAGNAGTITGLTFNLHDTSQFLYGSASASFQAVSSPSGQYYLSSGSGYLPVAGVSYIFSAYVYVPIGSPITTINIGIRDYVTYNYVSNNGTPSTFTLTPGQWTRIYTPPTVLTTVSENWRFTIGDPGGTFTSPTTYWVDGTQLEVAPPDGLPSSYFDGTFPNYQWDGSANGSISETSRDLIFMNQAPIQVFDAETVTENVNIHIVNYISVFDTETESESVSILEISNVNVFDADTVTDVPNLYITILKISVFETENVIDVVNFNETNIENVFDQETVTDSPVYYVDTVYALESIFIEVVNFINVFDTEVVTDVPNLGYTDFVNVSDTEVVTEAVTMQIQAFPINVFDVETVSDTNFVFEQSIISNASFALYGDSATTNQRLAQSFSHIQTVAIQTLNVVLSSFGSPTDILTINVVSSLDGTVLGTTSINTAFLTGAPTVYSLSFSPAPMITANTTYYLEFVRGTTDTSNYPLIGYDSSANPYPNGSAWEKSGGTWSQLSSESFYFVLYDGNPIIVINTNISVFDLDTVTDVPNIQIPFYTPQVFDVETVTDVPTVVIPVLNISVFDADTVTDVPTIQTVQEFINVFDSETITESVTLNLVTIYQINVYDVEVVTDVPMFITDVLEISVFDFDLVTEYVLLDLPKTISATILMNVYGANYILQEGATVPVTLIYT